jgi:DNA-binding response OmpR family regulator
MKVLYMSGHTDRVISKSGIRRKEVAFLPKPFTPAELTAKVREVLENDGKTNHA